MKFQIGDCVIRQPEMQEGYWKDSTGTFNSSVFRVKRLVGKGYIVLDGIDGIWAASYFDPATALINVKDLRDFL